MKLFLFDVDGVLVHHRAYHLGLQRAVGLLATGLGLDGHALTQADVDEFETAAVTVEWESCAIAVARLLVDRFRFAPVAGPIPETYWALAASLAAQPVTMPRPDFVALARASAITLPGQRPSLAMLERFLEEVQDEPFGPSLTPVLKELLGHCYDITKGPAMQVVQALAVGADAYRKSYGLEPHIEAESLLETADRPFLAERQRETLLEGWRAGTLGMSLYTARPSRPPREAPDRPLGYTPEAEAALKLVGLEDIPVIAVGKLQYVGDQQGLPPEALVKPARVHSLAAMAAARTGKEFESIEAAIRVDAGGPVSEPLLRVAGDDVHVFEDSASSLRAVTRSVALLNEHGLGLTLTRHGIAPTGSPRAKTLGEIADHVWPDINVALDWVLQTK